MKSPRQPLNVHYPSPILSSTSEPKPKPVKPVRYPSPEDFRYHGVDRGEGGGGGKTRIKYPDPEIRPVFSEKATKVKDDVKYPHPPNMPHDSGMFNVLETTISIIH